MKNRHCDVIIYYDVFRPIFVVDLIIIHTGSEPRSQSYSLSSFRYCVIFFDSCKTVRYCSFAIDILLDLIGEKRLRCEEIRAVTNLEMVSASGSETSVSSSMPTSAIIYDAYTSTNLEISQLL